MEAAIEAGKEEGGEGEQTGSDRYRSASTDNLSHLLPARLLVILALAGLRCYDSEVSVGH